MSEGGGGPVIGTDKTRFHVSRERVKKVSSHVPSFVFSFEASRVAYTGKSGDTTYICLNWTAGA